MASILNFHQVISLLVSISLAIAMINWVVTLFMFRFKIKPDIEKRFGCKLEFTSIYHKISPWDWLLGGICEMFAYMYIKFLREKVFRRSPGKIKWMAECALDKIDYQFDKKYPLEIFTTVFGLINGCWFIIVGGLIYLNVIQIDIPKTTKSISLIRVENSFDYKLSPQIIQSQSNNFH